MSSSALAFAPATVANVTCGFDLLGFALDALGDRVHAVRVDGAGVHIASVQGDGGRLPTDPTRNTAGVAAAALLQARAEAGRESGGVELTVHKGMPLASGLGSSAASSVAAVVAVDSLYADASPRSDLLRAAMEGERVACGAAHADNVAPALYGGLVMVRGSEPRVDSLTVDPAYYAAVVHPHAEVSTGEARAVLPASVTRETAVGQAGDLAALVTALATGNDDLLASSLEDRIAEPVRAAVVPGFEAARAAAREAGALGGGLSGSGPSQFAIARGEARARSVVEAMRAAIGADAGIESDVYVAPVGTVGARLENS